MTNDEGLIGRYKAVLCFKEGCLPLNREGTEHPAGLRGRLTRHRSGREPSVGGGDGNACVPGGRVGLRSDACMIRGYINTLGQRLVPEGMREKVKLSFRVIEAAEPNAFALADGRIYITTGMIAFAENEAQIAATLGHEIGHVLKEHLVSSIYRQTYGKVATASRIAGIAGGLLGGRETQEAMERTMSLVRALTGGAVLSGAGEGSGPSRVRTGSVSGIRSGGSGKVLGEDGPSVRGSIAGNGPVQRASNA